MAMIYLFIVPLFGIVSSQTADRAQIWSSVAYIMYGDRTPLQGQNASALTPLGAQQLYAQGSVFRDRYLNIPITSASNQTIEYEGIVNIERNAIDNTQLSILSTNDSWVSVGASAFMQSLYPPISQAFADGTGGMAAAGLANGSLVNFPLDGYQYANILTTSTLDPNSIWIEGHVECSEYQNSALQIRNEGYAQNIYNSTLAFYSHVWTSVLSNTTFSQSMANFFYAYDVYDYASYNYIHDKDTQTQLLPGDLDLLGNYAALQKQDQNGNLTASGLTPDDMIRAIAGRTLMAKILADLQANMATGGATNKLNLMFGSFEPLLALFSLTGLAVGPSASTFRQAIPGPGAAAVFELYTIGANTSQYPSADDLWVRFLYRNSSDSDAKFVQYALFGNDVEQSEMRYSDFVDAMADYAIDSVTTWCDICNASATVFCSGSDDSSTIDGSASGSNNNIQGSATNISPAVAGVIGAAVSVAAISLGLIVAIIFGGVRFYRLGHEAHSRRRSSLGGFKGAEKMPSDADVAYAGSSGVHHERTGSWELQDGGKSAGDGIVAASSGAAAVGLSASVRPDDLPRDLPESHAKNFDDDAISVINQVPVTPREF